MVQGQGRCPGTQQHAEEVAGLVRIGEQIEFAVEAGPFQLVTHVAQRRKILDGKAD